ncbi:hypothetical protein [Amycolatopsis cihanbeyliensis]|uniref:Uncharacterized protein n=1 Tax=Amycolatopsis cihanbeyliensis TaxID=1128664 RepID=A0A542DRL1_AMYCI|nr:hypothetical protein [Amycolatopsis cihanbeyliensis]TQJ05730.1 hypothetical protein FB471_5567 [Amycolatopsis cihanbeyliensis]
MPRNRRGSNDFRYTGADRCTGCQQRAVIPSEVDADRFVAKAEGRLRKQRCPHGNGWHLINPEYQRHRRARR